MPIDVYILWIAGVIIIVKEIDGQKFIDDVFWTSYHIFAASEITHVYDAHNVAV